jgi:phosphoribosylformylglycinamidine cyclo-ligase
MANIFDLLPESIDPGFAGRHKNTLITIDGVGTKTVVATAMGGKAHVQIGRDIVHHCANDLLASWALPAAFVDCVLCYRLDRMVFAGVMQGISEACAWHNCAFVSGETAIMDILNPGSYDVIGCMTGTPMTHVEGKRTPAIGDMLIGLPAYGLHTNGYTLARSCLHGAHLSDHCPGSSYTIGEALMEPHAHYDVDVLNLLLRGLVCAMAHITGGGIETNVTRVLPKNLRPIITSWPSAPAIMEYVIKLGNVTRGVARETFNMGVGFVVVAAQDNVDKILGVVPQANVIGYVGARD